MPGGDIRTFRPTDRVPVKKVISIRTIASPMKG